MLYGFDVERLLILHASTRRCRVAQNIVDLVHKIRIDRLFLIRLVEIFRSIRFKLNARTRLATK